MNNETILYAIGMIDDEAILDAKAHSGAMRQGSRGMRRRLGTLLLAAVLILSLAAVAYAIVKSDWFKSFFESESNRELTPDQQQFLEENSVGIGESVTINGYTVTLEAALCDDWELYLKLRIVAPEGVTLDFPNEDDGTCLFEDVSYHSSAVDPSNVRYRMRGGGWRPLEDGDGKENTATIVFYEQTAEGNHPFTDGEMWNVTLSNLMISQQDPEKDFFCHEYLLIAEGEWSFTIPLTEMNERLELIDEPVAFATPYGNLNGPVEYVDILITSFELRPFGATCKVVADTDCLDSFDALVVMKDGSEVKAWRSMAFSYRFDEPLLLENVAYVLLQNGRDELRLSCPSEYSPTALGIGEEATAPYRRQDTIEPIEMTSDGTLMLKGGLVLPIDPAMRDKLVFYVSPSGPTYEMLLTVAEKASAEACDKLYPGQYMEAGELFCIYTIDEWELRELLCGSFDGRIPFAVDADGRYYVWGDLGDLYFMREEGTNLEESKDRPQWEEARRYADTLLDVFLTANPSLTPVSFRNSDLDICLSMIRWHKGMNYTLSGEEFGALAPGSVDPEPFIERLLAGSSLDEVEDVKTQDGACVTLSLPDDDLHFAFFLVGDGQNYIHMVWEDEELFYRISYDDDSKTAGKIMLEWYEALAEAQGLK